MEIGDYDSMLAGLHFAPPLNRNYVSQILTWSDEVTPNPDANSSPTSSRALRDWVKEVALLTRPDAVVWCDGSEAEKNRLTKQAVAAGILIELNQTKRPGCYLHRSNPNDVARTEQLTFVCTPNENRRRAYQQLVGSRRDIRQAARMARRLDARAHDVRGAVRAGPARVAVLEGRHRAHRQHLRRAEHANHDADGRGGARSTWRVGRFQSRNSLHARFESRAPPDLPLPAGQHDHLGRQRLRRQRTSQQEMFRASNRKFARPRRRLARRAHADPRPAKSRRRDHLCRGRVSERMRQDQSRDADAAGRVQGLEGLHDRRRYRVDAGRSRRRPVGGQSRERLLRRRARHQRKIESERDEDGRA